MRSKIVLVVLSVVAGLTAVMPAAGATEAAPTGGATLELVRSGLSTVVDIAAPAGDDRLFVVEKVGRIRIIDNGTLLSTPFLDITGPVDTSSGERGLLGLTFDPDYVTNGRFYVNYTAESGGGDSVVERYTVSANDPNRANTNGTRLLTQNQPFGNHNGGDIAFGPDGYLYASFGDGGSGGDPQDNAQNINNLLGTIVRIDPDDGSGAPGNPFIGAPGDDRIWAYGFRNPWRFDFDAATGDIIVGDVGENRWEEIDRIPAGEGGLNFGWDDMEGDHCFEPSSGCDTSGKVRPIHEYAHGSDPCSGSITGGIVYRGNDLPWLRGTYFYADYCKNFLRSLRVNKNGNAIEHQTWTSALGAPGNILTFGEDGFGEMYLSSGGSVYKLVPDGPAECDFNGDGRSDLAVGVPGEDHSGKNNAGLVQVFDGAASGLLDIAGDLTLKVGDNITGTPRNGDRFGDALACGDFDGDGYVDLAIGAPKRDIAGKKNAGAVYVAYGGQGGLGGASEVWHQDRAGVPGGPQRGDRYGSSLATGDFNRDGYADLAVGIPRENVDDQADAGAVGVLYGAASGLSSTGAETIHQNKKGIQGSAGDDWRFGEEVAAADFDGDGYVDLAAGIPGMSNGDGALQLVFGNKAGVGTRDFLFALGDGSGFGSGLAAGHLDNDAFDDIAIGSRNQGDGRVHVFYGHPKLPATRSDVFVPGDGLPTPNDASQFGFANAVGDFNGDGVDDLAIGNSGDTVGADESAGSVVVLYSGIAGPQKATAEQWHRDAPGIAGGAQAGDVFGAALAAVDLNGDGRDELAIGLPGNGGEVTVLRGRKAGFSGKGDKRLEQGRNGANGNAQKGDRFGAAL